MQEKTCIVCGQARDEGVSIWDQFICSECEREMVRTDVHDQRYSYFIQQMRKIWFKKDA